MDLFSLIYLISLKCSGQGYVKIIQSELLFLILFVLEFMGENIAFREKSITF